MARKPGTHTSTLYAFKSQILGKYLYARAWEYHPQDYAVRVVETRENPVLVAKSEKTARTLLGMLPDYLNKQLAKADESVYKAQRELDHAISCGHHHRYYESNLNGAIAHRTEIMTLLNHPIDIVLIEIVTETKETVV